MSIPLSPRVSAFPVRHGRAPFGMDRYLEIAKEILASQGTDDRLEHRGYLAYAGLRRMEKRFQRILFLCDFPLLGRLQELFREGSIPGLLAQAENRGSGPAESV